MIFAKYHALGNDYLVIPITELDKAKIKRICDRHYGIGADGILLGPLQSKSCDFGLRIFYPDGSEAEKNGNGLRIFSRYLWDEGFVDQASFTVETPGGVFTCQVGIGGKFVAVESGKIDIGLSTDFSAKMQEPVTRICTGSMDREIFE